VSKFDNFQKINQLVFVVAAVLLLMQAAPLRKIWYKLVPSAKLVKCPTDIWLNCSKCCNYKELLLFAVLLLLYFSFTLPIFCTCKSGNPAKIVITPDPPVKGQPFIV